MAGSICASAAIARMVARSYPSAANRSRAASRIAARVASDRRGRVASVTSTIVGQQMLAYDVNSCWPPGVDMDVIVVGAGPTGLLLAGDLAAAGISFTVLERRVEESNLTRAFAVHARTLEELDARGIADELVATGKTI